MRPSSLLWEAIWWSSTALYILCKSWLSRCHRPHFYILGEIWTHHFRQPFASERCCKSMQHSIGTQNCSSFTMKHSLGFLWLFSLHSSAQCTNVFFCELKAASSVRWISTYLTLCHLLKCHNEEWSWKHEVEQNNDNSNYCFEKLLLEVWVLSVFLHHHFWAFLLYFSPRQKQLCQHLFSF